MKKTILVLIGLSLWGLIYFFLQKTQEKVTAKQNSHMQAEFTEIMKFNLQNINHSTWVTWQQMGVNDTTQIIVRAVFFCPEKESADQMTELLQKDHLKVDRSTEYISGHDGYKLVATYPRYAWSLLKMNNIGKSLLLNAKSLKCQFLYFDVDKSTVPNPDAVIF